MTAGSALASLIAFLAPVVSLGASGRKLASIDTAAENLATIRQKWTDLDQDQQRTIARAFGRYLVQPTGRGADRINVTPLSPNLGAVLG
jgi:hypothetical protein